MPTLAEMLAAKKAKSLSPSNQEAPHGESSVGNGAVDSVRAVAETSTAGDDTAPSEPESVSPTSTGTPVAPVAGIKPIIGGLRLNALRLGSAPAVQPGGTPSGNSGVNLNLREAVSPEPAGQSDSDIQSDDASGVELAAIGDQQSGGSLVDIAGLGEELDGFDPEADDSIPLDHIPVSAPARSLPDNLTNQQAQFIKSLDSLYNLHADPTMFVDMVRRIMTDMQDNPALVGLLADDDSYTMITGLRQQAGMAQVKKIESKAKKGGAAGGARSVKNKSVEDSVMASLSAFAGMSLD
jgi:hypothetical protein